ncbi:MAG TPA: LysR family transcriptional regulator [Stellaceae bacterium]|jgi:DNA-binding transcriptional LysR family regulator|nr:LysR family transcriptional regulator [Stellaceae bacterium]
MTFDLRQLRAFLAIADSGSLGRAAATINLSQPALSRIIHDMEARVGAKLFERHTKGMALTQYGEALLPYARLLIFETGQAVEALDAVRGLRRGTARIGAVATVARSILPAAVSRLLTAAPGLQIQLLEAADDALATALRRREVDIAITGILEKHDDIVPIAECQFQDRCLVFCAADHPLTAEPKVTLDQVLAENWIMPGRGARPRELFEEVLRAGNIRMPRIAVEVASPSAIAAFVAQTHLLGWLPQPLFHGREQAGKVKTLDIPELSLARSFLIYRRRQGLLSEPVMRLMRELPLLDASPKAL